MNSLGTMSGGDLDTLLGSPSPAAPAAAPVQSAPPPAATPSAPPAPAPAAKPADAPAPAKPADTPPPAPAAPAPGSEDDGPNAEQLGKFRHRARDFKEAEFLKQLRTKSPEEAYAAVYGSAAPVQSAPPAATAAPAAKPATPDAPSAPDFDAQTKAAQDEITRLEADLTKASDDADTKAVADLTRKLVTKESELRDIARSKREAEQSALEQQHSAEQSAYRQKQIAARDEALKLYPALADKTSEERKEFDRYIALKQGDADYEGIFASPRWPLIMAREFAEVSGKKLGAPAPAASTPPAAQPTPAAAPAAPRVTSAEVLTPGAPGGTATFTPTRESLMADVSKMSLEDLDRLL
ncbi:hypothetical protein [Geminisphaera colitermitum]|uniref:hypothetical protein n=1 Tax=Geminisphaera colitermitum TaxID=1148786 RepID=UPI000158C823|nr:hypothetical protein [Geminisphaera colitermitum]